MAYEMFLFMCVGLLWVRGIELTNFPTRQISIGSHLFDGGMMFFGHVCLPICGSILKLVVKISFSKKNHFYFDLFAVFLLLC